METDRNKFILAMHVGLDEKIIINSFSITNGSFICTLTSSDPEISFCRLNILC